MNLRHRHPTIVRRSDESGETLIELMATVVLMGVSIVALVSALLGVMTTTAEHRRATRAGNEAVNVVEVLRGVDYKPCAVSTSYNANLPPAPRGYTFSITSVQRLASATAATPTWVTPVSANNPACTAPVAGVGGTDTGAQKITVKVTSTASANVSRSLTLVKRNKYCPGAPAADPEDC